jgi:hypothetical protein
VREGGVRIGGELQGTELVFHARGGRCTGRCVRLRATKYVAALMHPDGSVLDNSSRV